MNREPTPEEAKKLQSEIRPYTFHRKEGWYQVQIPKDTVEDNAKCNPGTLKVTDALTGEVVWEAKP